MELYNEPSINEPGLLPRTGRVVVRSWHPEDTMRLHELVSQNDTFTHPSRYLFDVIANCDPGLNLVAALPDGRPIAYMLSIRSAPRDIFIWQIASERSDRNLRQLSGEGVAALFEQFRRTLKSLDTQCVQFTTGSEARTRWAAKIVRKIFGVELRDLRFKIDGERAYEIRLDGENPSHLSDIYTMPGFSSFVRNVFTADRLSRDWLREIAALGPGDNVLEIGAGDGRVTRELLKTGAKITAVEPSPQFCPWLEQVARTQGVAGARVIDGYFPDIPHPNPDNREDCYSHVIVHQNVFLEMANQMDYEDLLFELSCFMRKPGGKMLFDYITDADPGEPFKTVPIFSGTVPGIGDVHYEREYMGYHGGMRYEVQLRFSVQHETLRKTHHKRVEVRLLPLDRIEAHIGALGGVCIARPIEAFTFFPARSNLIEATFMH